MSVRRWSCTSLTVGALAVVLAACGSSSSTGTSSTSSKSSGSSSASASNVAFKSIEQTVPQGYPQPKAKKLVVAFMNPEGSSNEFLTILGKSMGLEVRKLGGTYIEKDAEGDVNAQVSELDQLIAQHVNGIVVFPLDPKSVQPDVARARKAGIHLITIDYNFASTTNLGSYESQVWQRRDEAAYMTATEVAKLAGAGAPLGTIDLVIKVPSIVFTITRDGYWAKQLGMKVEGNASNPSDDIAGGEKAMTTLLGSFPSLKGVMAYNDPSAIGAYSAARAQGTTNLVLAGENGGTDALGAIKAGRETFTIKLDAPSMGKDFAWGLYDLSEAMKIPPTVKAGSPVLVDKSNVNSTLTWEQQLKQEYPGS